VEHRLFGTACLVGLLVPASPSGVVVERGWSGVWCLARCWVLKARAFFACSSVRALLAGRTASSPEFWGVGLAPASGGVPPVF